MDKKRKTLRKIDGFVWCDRHGEIHTDELDPYDWEPADHDQVCKEEDHRPVYGYFREDES